ncbi:oxidoreductase [Acidisarcina polymorpha]|uniref:Oxidoreductase n=1 Tax=Acidisarcina polymorpha TaxID=2211140 RepID=A0A2Z5FU17_9BACT|nr:oxidoreductase [Acidisarcina polymorpha]
MAQEVGSRSLRSPNLTSCLPQPLPSKCFVWCYGLNLAVEAGAKVIATTRSRDRFKKLEDLGVYRAELEGPELSTRIAEAKHIDAVLDLVGNSVILDSLRILRRGGRACLAGWLGGWLPSRNSTRCYRWPVVSI